MAILFANDAPREKSTPAGGWTTEYERPDVEPAMPCRKCGADVKFSSETSEEGRIGASTCVVISQVVDKFWAKEKKAVQLREEGNKHFQVGSGLII